jgi:hypothetical protein
MTTNFSGEEEETFSSSLENIDIYLDTEEEILNDIQDWGDGAVDVVGRDDDDGFNHQDIVSSQSDKNFWRKLCLHKTFDILLEIFSLLFTICDMCFVGILVYRHYMEGKDALQAWAMLLPIFLSTLGVQLFFEKYPPTKHWYNEILNVPLVGPIFCTGELLYAKFKSGSVEMHRIEAESIKLKQYESMFRAFPEGMVGLCVHGL